MRKYYSVQKISVVLCILLLTTVFTGILYAQNEGTDQQVYQVLSVQIKPGMDMEFEQFIQSIMPALKEMGIPELSTSKTGNFGVADKYSFLMPLQDPAAMDAELSASQENVPIWAVSMSSAMQRMASSVRSYMLIPRPDLGEMWEDGYQWKLASDLRIGVAPGREQEFEKALKEAVAVIKKTNIKALLIGKTGLGGDMNEYEVAVFYDSYKDMLANGPKIQTELAAANLTPMTGIVYSVDNEVIVNVPELSIQPAAQ
ncbi:MAG: hypothetical protein P8Z37_09010 [Acidobacteriota bacterium]|jgi:hypothetical protein